MSGTTGTQTGGAAAQSSSEVAQRTIHELETLMSSLDLTDGDPDTMQVGGTHREVKKVTKGTGYQSHHIPARSAFDENADDLPTIAITDEDHKLTSSFGGRMNKSYDLVFGADEGKAKHKDSVKQLLDQGMLAEVIRDEVYEFQRDYGTKYDGGLKQYIQSMIGFLKRNGMPRNK